MSTFQIDILLDFRVQGNAVDRMLHREAE